MLLNDTVGHRQAEAGAFLRAFGGEKGIVDPVQMFGRDPMAGIGHFHLHAGAVPPGTDFERASARHGVARIQEEIQKHLLQLSLIHI